MRAVRFYAIKALRANPSLHQAWALLGDAYSDAGVHGHNEPSRTITTEQGVLFAYGKRQKWFRERAIFCYARACNLCADNVEYNRELSIKRDIANEPLNVSAPEFL